jgi:hypothetical protein
MPTPVGWRARRTTMSRRDSKQDERIGGVGTADRQGLGDAAKLPAPGP